MRLGLSVGMYGFLVAASAVTFFAVALATLALLGEERLVYYHHEIAVLAVSALLLYGFGYPVLRYLDVVIISLGVFLVFGRFGCFSVGCCHGMPHRFGFRYREEHAAVGFPRYLVGVRLLPVQVLEAFFVAILTAAAAVALVAGSPPGVVTTTQLVGYALMRFSIEFVRGDDLRPTWKGFSEAQWTSIALAVAVVVAECVGVAPRSQSHVAALTLLLAAVSVVALLRRRAHSSHRWLAPRHVHEVAQALAADAGVRSTDPIRMRVTSLGVRLSSCSVQSSGVSTSLHTLSGVDRAGAMAVSGLIVRLQPRSSRASLLERSAGVFQVVVTPAIADIAGIGIAADAGPRSGLSSTPLEVTSR